MSTIYSENYKKNQDQVPEYMKGIHNQKKEKIQVKKTKYEEGMKNIYTKMVNKEVQRAHPFGLAEPRFQWSGNYGNGNDIKCKRAKKKMYKDNLEGGIGRFLNRSVEYGQCNDNKNIIYNDFNGDNEELMNNNYQNNEYYNNDNNNNNDNYNCNCNNGNNNVNKRKIHTSHNCCKNFSIARKKKLTIDSFKKTQRVLNPSENKEILKNNKKKIFSDKEKNLRHTTCGSYKSLMEKTPTTFVPKGRRKIDSKLEQKYKAVDIFSDEFLNDKNYNRIFGVDRKVISNKMNQETNYFDQFIAKKKEPPKVVSKKMIY